MAYFIPLAKYDRVRPNTPDTAVSRAWRIGPNWSRLPVLVHTVVLELERSELDCTSNLLTSVNQ